MFCKAYWRSTGDQWDVFYTYVTNISQLILRSGTEKEGMHSIFWHKIVHMKPEIPFSFDGPVHPSALFAPGCSSGFYAGARMEGNH